MRTIREFLYSAYKKAVILFGAVVGCLVFCNMVIGCLESPDEIVPILEPEPVELSREEMIQNQFSELDGRHYLLFETVKKLSKDPSSLQHIETRYKVNKDSLYVLMTFRGRNSFNGYSIESISASYTLEGKLLYIR